ncbi:hypothetical protein [Nonomuraea jiangxiensis]|uniref:Lipoprotein n=1 Tax=Nonomuraea jiangxiensis TaxID=633440 RepID=A0A1G9BYS4_9ACTN|nr:hypothetical protein [Nonomuraea jiangxiensis]SDK44601.1 hypothetical protein SAMN05421869_11618 [Nonomuraea jiangxiensis]
MKLTIIVLAAGATLAAGTGPAQAAPQEDPVRAFKATLVAGHGVRFTETATVVDGTEERKQTSRGTFRFDSKGVAAFDITATTIDSQRRRTIGIQREWITYVAFGDPSGPPVEGKNYHDMPSGGLSDSYGQVLNPAEPTTLAALLRNGKRSNDTVTGTITFGAIGDHSRWFRSSAPTTDKVHTVVSYTLTLTPAGLVSRLQSAYRTKERWDAESRRLESRLIAVDTRYSGWGGKVSVKAPDPRTVAFLPRPPHQSHLL